MQWTLGKNKILDEFVEGTIASEFMLKAPTILSLISLYFQQKNLTLTAEAINHDILNAHRSALDRIFANMSSCKMAVLTNS